MQTPLNSSMTTYSSFRNKTLSKYRKPVKLGPIEEFIHDLVFGSYSELVEWKYLKYKL